MDDTDKWLGKTVENLQENEEFYRSVVENTTAVILRVNPQGIIKFANQHALNFFGYSKDELIGKHAVGTIVPEVDTDGRDLAKMVDEIAENPDRFHSNENENMLKNGERVWIEWTNSGIYDKSGNLKEFLSVGIDATGRKKAEEREELLKALMDSNPSLVFMKDKDGRYIYLNKSYEKKFIHSKDWYGKTDFDFWPKESAELFQSNDAEVLKSGKIQQFMEDSTDMDGTRYVWLNYKFPFIDSKGKKYVGGIGIDATARIIAEEELKESETQLKTIIKNLEEGLVVSDLDGTLINWNPTAIKMHGFSSIEEGIRKFPEFADIFELSTMDGNVLPVDQWPAARILRGEHLKDFVVHIKRINSRWERIFSYGGTLVRDAQDQPLMAIITLNDITERQKAVNMLKESETRFRSVLDNSLDALYRLNLKTSQYEYMSPAFEDVVGYPPNEFISMTAEEAMSIIHPDDLSLVKDALARLAKEGHVKVEYRICDSRGKYRWLSNNISLIRDAEGHPLYRDGTIRDVTQQKKDEEELRQAHDTLEDKVEERTVELEEAYQTLKESELKAKQRADLLQMTHEAIFVRDMDDKITFWNKGAEELYGWTATEALGKVAHDMLKTEFPELLKQIKLDIMSKGGWNGELIHEKVDGTKVNILSRWSLQKDEQNKPIGFLIVNTDITARKQAEEQMKVLIDDLKRSNEELQSFAYITSHDLQEPLRTMGNYAGLLKHRYSGQLDGDADEFLDFMASGAARMKDMVQGLLDYSRVGTQGEEFGEFSAEEALDSALINLKSAIEECHTKITHDSLPVISADKGQISRVFQNLIGNALKFRRKGVPPKIHISAEKKDNEYVFSVADNGIGIEKQYKEHIFEVFKRLHAIGEYQGVGIGLATVKRIIERHGGHVWVESEFGIGSTFYFTIPISKMG